MPMTDAPVTSQGEFARMWRRQARIPERDDMHRGYFAKRQIAKDIGERFDSIDFGFVTTFRWRDRLNVIIENVAERTV